MVRKKYDGSKYSSAVPWARFKKMDGRFNCLIFNKAAIKLYGLKIGSRVDLIWDSFDKLWERPVIVIKLNGTQRSIVNDERTSYRQVRIHVQRFMKQYEIPYIEGPLPILDFVDGEEITIDMSGELEERVRHIKAWKTKLRPAENTKRFEIWLSNQNRIGIRSNDLFFKVIERLATIEDKSKSVFILDAVQFYIEDKYPDMFEALRKAVIK